MTDNELLAAEELEFLLQQAEAQSHGEEFANLSHAENARVTIRGNLDKINLADIFQTLGMSKMEGILRVRNALESREIFFHDGQVRYRFPARSEAKRLGQRLIRSKLITADQLRMALLVQKKSPTALGPILVEHDYIIEEDLERVANEQLQEDLLDLFTWQKGFFEFYKGAPDDPTLIERFKQAPEFDVSSVLLEVAARADEWELILQTLHSVDEIPIITQAFDTSGLGKDDMAVLRQIDGEQSIRELAESTTLGLFGVARVVMNLFNNGFVELLDPDGLLAVAEESVATGNIKRALLVVQTLHDGQDDLPPEMVLAMADVLQKCGEPRMAAKALLASAERLEEPDDRIEIAERGRQLDRRSMDILRFLQREYVEANLTNTKEFLDVASDLGEALSEKGAHNEALEVISRLETSDVRQSAVLSRKARILHKADNTEEAVDVLMKLAEIWRGRGDRTRLVGLYEQILKIDPKRKDVAKALRQLKSTKTRRHLKRAGAIIILLGLVFSGAWYVDNWNTQLRIQDIEQRVRDKLLVSDVKAAQRIVAAAAAELGQREEFDVLRRAISRVLKDEKHALKAQKLGKFRKRMEVASEHIAAGRLRQALLAYAEMLKDRSTATEVRKMAAVDLRKLRPLLHEQAEALEMNMPNVPDELQDDETRSRILLTLQQNLKGNSAAVARGLLENRDDPTLQAILGQLAHVQIIELAERLRSLVETARQRQREYLAYQAKVNRQRRLDPLYLAAREHERRYEFAKALKLYRQLEREHPEQDDLKVYFKDQVNRYATIVKFVESIAKAVAKGDFESAQGQYRSLRRSYSDIPFDRLVRLPFHVVTTPPGATVRLNGQPVGKSPLLASYYPAARTKVRVELPGFRPEQVTIRGDQVGLVRSILAKEPDWTFQTKGSVERQPVEDINNQIFLVDRAGIIYCIDGTTHEQRWKFETRDLSGFLTRPRIYRNLLLVGSVDGRLRALDRNTGTEVWHKDELPCEASPAVCGNFLVVATTKRRLYAVNLKKPEEKPTELLNQALPDDVKLDLHCFARTAIITLHSGLVLRINNKGNELWKVNVGGGIATGSFLTPKALVVASDEGVVTAIDVKTGRKNWSRGELGGTGPGASWEKCRCHRLSPTARCTWSASSTSPPWTSPTAPSSRPPRSQRWPPVPLLRMTARSWWVSAQGGSWCWRPRGSNPSTCSAAVAPAARR
ncbi:MAG: DUF4388 domain-containing protein [Planctomycetota bacterium]|jgi:tetratricopeptide (TPR) repeat protein